MKRDWLWRLLLVAPALAGCDAIESSAVDAEVMATKTEPAWGRIYLRNGLAPIQYFRDSFGGDMVPREVEFYFPQSEQSRLGCSLLSLDEQDAIKRSNGSTVIVVDRGECTFETKSRVAQSVGAAGLIVVSTNEEVSGPAAVFDNDADDEEDMQISIPSVMIRRSAGDMLRAAAAKQPVFGWLMPMVCNLHPYKCLPRSADEKTYISETTARGGRIHLASATDDDAPIAIGTFLASTYGSTLSTSKAFNLKVVADASQACADQDASLDQRDLEGKAAMIAVGTDHCSIFEQVSAAQRSGAEVAIVALPENATAMAHASVKDSWVAYNITIPSVSVSSATALSLQRLGHKSAIRFSLENQVADDWEQIRKLSLHTSWPVRKERREKLVRKLMADLSIFQGPDHTTAVEALKRQFLSIGGTAESWRRLRFSGDEEDGEGEAASDKSSAGPVRAKAAVDGEASPHEEL